MKRFSVIAATILTALATTAIAANAATIEYTFTVPFEVKGAGQNSASGGPSPLAITCAVGPVSLGYSTGTQSATNATGTGTTQNVRSSPATVVVTIDGQPRTDQPGAAPAGGAGTVLQPTQPSGYYTCWGKFASGVTPVNFIPTTKLPAAGPKIS